MHIMIYAHKLGGIEPPTYAFAPLSPVELQLQTNYKLYSLYVQVISLNSSYPIEKDKTSVILITLVKITLVFRQINLLQRCR